MLDSLGPPMKSIAISRQITTGGNKTVTLSLKDVGGMKSGTDSMTVCSMAASMFNRLSPAKDKEGYDGLTVRIEGHGRNAEGYYPFNTLNSVPSLINHIRECIQLGKDTAGAYLLFDKTFIPDSVLKHISSYNIGLDSIYGPISCIGLNGFRIKNYQKGTLHFSVFEALMSVERKSEKRFITVTVRESDHKIIGFWEE
jgi:hypothetical protein